MKTTLRNKIEKFVAGLLLVAVGTLIVNNVVFLHSHKLSNGKILIHAHPYNKHQDSAPFKKHNHTKKELFQISHIQLLFFVSIFLITAISFARHTKEYFYRIPSVYFKYFFRLKGREPPILTELQ